MDKYCETSLEWQTTWPSQNFFMKLSLKFKLQRGTNQAKPFHMKPYFNIIFDATTHSTSYCDHSQKGLFLPLQKITVFFLSIRLDKKYLKIYISRLHEYTCITELPQSTYKSATPLLLCSVRHAGPSQHVTPRANPTLPQMHGTRKEVLAAHILNTHTHAHIFVWSSNSLKCMNFILNLI